VTAGKPFNLDQDRSLEMIVDRLANASLYFGTNPRIDAALRHLAEVDATSLALGTHQIDGDDVFAIVQEYESRLREGAFWEAHRKFIDVQYITAGVESIGYANLAGMEAGPYDEEKDLVVAEGDGDFVTLCEGTFMILHPEDAHMPGLAVDAPSTVRKIVVKVRV